MKLFLTTSTLLALSLTASAQMEKTAGMQATPSKPAMQMPRDMTMPSVNDPSAQKETESIRGSETEQHGQATAVPGSDSDAESFQLNSFTVQERENPAGHTGATLPAPDLLAAVIARAPMGLDDFLALARHANPTLTQMHAAVERSQQQARQAGLPPDPTIGYSGDHIRGGEYHGGEQGLFIQQELVLGGKLGLRRNVYNQEARANQIGVEEQQYRVDDSVEQAFYDALAAQAEVVVRQRMLKVAQDASITAHQLSNLGQADAPDVLQAEVEAEQAQVDFVDAQRNYLQRFQALAAVSGTFNLSVTTLRGDIESPPSIDTQQQSAQILTLSPETRRAQQGVDIAEARLKAARREPVPNLTVKAGEWYSGEEIASSGKETGPMSFVEAGVNLPVWNHNQGNIDAAKASVEEATAELTRTRLALQQKTDMLVQSYLSAQFTVDRYRTELLPRARRAYQLYVMKYQQMASGYPQVLLSQRTLFQLQINYVQALREEWTDALTLNNFTLTNGLAAPMMSGTSSTDINLPDGSGRE